MDRERAYPATFSTVVSKNPAGRCSSRPIGIAPSPDWRFVARRPLPPGPGASRSQAFRGAGPVIYGDLRNN